MTIECTKTGVVKLQSYTNLSRESCEKLIKRAFINGVPVEDMPVKDREYLERLFDSSKRQGYVYGEYCYVFAGYYCVNVFKQQRKSNFCGKNKIKHPKKFTKHYDFESDSVSA